MTKNQKTGIVYFIIAGIFFLLLIISIYSCGGNAYGQRGDNPTDTLPKYQKIFVITVDPAMLTTALDSVDRFALSYLGKSLSVDEASDRQMIYIRCIGRILSFGRNDSIPIPKPKK